MVLALPRQVGRPACSRGWVPRRKNACGIVPRPSLQPLHQALQQPGARLDRREEHVFMIRVCARAADAEPIKRWDPHRDREIAYRSTVTAVRPTEVVA